MKTITKGRYSVTIRQNGGANAAGMVNYCAIITRDGDCLHGFPAWFYQSMKTAERGARQMLRKAGA